MLQIRTTDIQTVSQSVENGLYQIPSEDYHAGPGISSTDIKALLISPAHYQTRKITSDDTTALGIGRAIHMGCLEPEEYKRLVAIEPHGMEAKNKSPGKKLWEDFKKANEGKEIFFRKDGDIIEGCISSLSSSDVFKRIMQGATCEVSAYVWAANDVLLKARADILNPFMIADIKTTQDARPDAFWREIKKYGYHISAAYYLDIFNQVLPESVDSFVWIVVEKSPPYAITFYVAPDDVIEHGRALYKKALQRYVECSTSGKWPAYRERFKTLETPRWFINEGELIDD